MNALNNDRPSCTSLFTKSSSAGGQFGSAVPPLPLQAGWRCSQGLGASEPALPVNGPFHPSEGDVATVATAASNQRIKRSAVVDSLRVATRPLDPAMAASVQSAALSQLQPDVRGTVAREEVARVWLMTVLPALERAPLRGPSGEIVTRRLTERLQRLMGSRLSQVMLDELAHAQEELGLSANAAGGGELPSALVQPFVAMLATAALSAAVRELGDSLLALPGLEGAATAGRQGSLEKTGGPSQADAVGAAEALVRRMLEGALHGHHAALAQAAAAEEANGEDDLLDVGGGGGDGGGGGGAPPGSPSAREVLRVREAQAALIEVRAELAALTTEHMGVLSDHEALLAAHRNLESELVTAQAALSQLRDEHARLLEEHAAMHEAASAEVSELEEQILSARATVDAEAAEAAESKRRGEHWASEAAALERERGALLGRVAAAESAAAAAAQHAAAAAALVVGDQRPAAPAYGAGTKTRYDGSYEDADEGNAPVWTRGGSTAAASPTPSYSPSLAHDEDDDGALMRGVTVPKAKAGSATVPVLLGSPLRNSMSPRVSSLAPTREFDALDHDSARCATYTDRDGSGHAGPTYVIDLDIHGQPHLL